MPGGKGAHIPTHCRDANGRKLPLFNPAVCVGEPPAGTDFTLKEWQTLLAGLKKKPPTNWLLASVLLTLIFGSFIYTMIASGWPWYAAMLFGTFPIWAMALLWGSLYFLASRTWGTLAFVNIHEDRVVGALLKRNRCPSCAYRLPYAAPDRRATCSECGAVWRSRNFKTSLPQPPSPCTSPAPSQDQPH